MTIKEKLYQRCQAFVEHRVESIRQAMASAQASANEETKSSAGDKYETGRAMMQLEIEKLSTQLDEVLKVKQQLDKISGTKLSSDVQPGSLVTTSGGVYYISISAGQFDVDGTIYFCLAAGSPIGQLMQGKRQGDQFTFNKKTIAILEVC